MLERSNIEQLLRINGVDVSAPDEEIKSILISARWHKDDVETALMVLRENTKDHTTHVDTLHKVFQTDEKLNSETISALLGIDVVIPPHKIESSKVHQKIGMSAGQIIQIALVSICFALIAGIASMMYLQIGVFHITMR